jgi:hypothetical protein
MILYRSMKTEFCMKFVWIYETCKFVMCVIYLVKLACKSSPNITSFISNFTINQPFHHIYLKHQIAWWWILYHNVDIKHSHHTTNATNVTKCNLPLDSNITIIKSINSLGGSIISKHVACFTLSWLLSLFTHLRQLMKSKYPI